MLPTLTPQDFVAKWRQAMLKECSAAQEHFLDLCRLVGHPTPAESDPAGEHFAFEKGASKQSGGSGFADVWKRGYFAWEYKGKHSDLSRISKRPSSAPCSSAAWTPASARSWEPITLAKKSLSRSWEMR